MMSYSERKTLERALAAPERLAALAEIRLLDQPQQPVLNRYVRLLREALGAPVGFVSLVDDRRQFFASAEGLSEPWATRRETPLSHSFCKHVVADGSALIVENAVEHPVVHDNLAIRDLSVLAYAGVPIRTAEGHVLGSFCAIDAQPRTWSSRELTILRDLAEGVADQIDLRRRALRAEASEARLARINGMLRESREQQSAAASAAIHDLRAPLNVMMLGVTSLLSHNAAQSFPEISKLLRMMERNVEHAASLVASMHEITRLSGELESRQPVDLIALAREVCDALHASSSVALEHPAEPATLIVEGDPSGLRRCLENLTSNAIRFSRAHVKVSLTSRDDEVEVSVEDDGCGLPTPESYHQVWLPNVRYHIEDGRSGSGLGLSIVREIVQRMGGHTRAKPSPMGGAKFILHLPLVSA